MSSPYLRSGIFLAPFHAKAENPTVALERDFELLQHLDKLNYHEAWIGEHHSGGVEIIAAPDDISSILQGLPNMDWIDCLKLLAKGHDHEHIAAELIGFAGEKNVRAIAQFSGALHQVIVGIVEEVRRAT